MPEDEFALIARLFAPLASDPGARGLLDDAAVLNTDGPLVVTCDAIVEGVHFLPDDPLDRVAGKALRVNLSDLAAKGAKPRGVLVALMWPAGRPVGELAAFADGLAKDLKAFDVALLGGDTTTTTGPLAVAVTALGRPCAGRSPARSDARPGQDVWVSGAIGDGILGLWVRQGRISPPAADADALAARYQTPEPRVGLAPWLSAHAGASMDVSDGLLADAAKIAGASGVRLDLDAAAVPISPPARRALAAGVCGMRDLLTGGDDYEVLFTAAPDKAEDLARAAAAANIPVTRIGKVVSGAGLTAHLPGEGDLAMGGAVLGHVHRFGQG